MEAGDTARAAGLESGSGSGVGPHVNEPAFRGLKGLSFAHSLVYAALLAVWIADVSPRLKNTLGWAHGLMWIGMSLLVIVAARKLIVSFRLAVLVVVIGGLGPFAGTAGFIVEDRARRKAGRAEHPDGKLPQADR